MACSDSLPGKTTKASGMPSMSMNMPICTMGLGRFSFDLPRLRSPATSSPVSRSTVSLSLSSISK